MTPNQVREADGLLDKVRALRATRTFVFSIMPYFEDARIADYRYAAGHAVEAAIDDDIKDCIIKLEALGVDCGEFRS